MHKIIRDDVIKLESYVMAAFKYDELLETLYECGGYAFQVQIKSKYGESRGKELIKGALEYKLIKLYTYSNHKYVGLSSSATKYIASKNLSADERVKTYRKISSHPSEKNLFTSVFKWTLLEQGRNEVKFDDYRNILLERIKHISLQEIKENRKIYVNKNYEKVKSENTTAMQLIESKDKHIVNIGRQLLAGVSDYRRTVEAFDAEIEAYESKLDALNLRIKKGIDYFKISKMIVLPEKDRLKMIIFDAYDIKSIAAYMNNIKSFENAYKEKFVNIEFEFLTYDIDRYNNFNKRIMKSKIYYPNRSLSLKAYDPSYEIIGKIKGSRLVSESVIKEKDRPKFIEIRQSIGQNK